MMIKAAIIITLITDLILFERIETPLLLKEMVVFNGSFITTFVPFLFDNLISTAGGRYISRVRSSKTSFCDCS